MDDMKEEYKPLDDDVVETLSDSQIEKLQDVAQTQERVKVKRNRGLSADIKKQLASNPNVTPNEVFEALKSNSYGGSDVKLSTIQSLMSQMKSKSNKVDSANVS